MTQSRVFVRYSPYFSLIGKLLPLVLLIGGYLFLQGELTLGALSAFVQYSTNIVWPMEMLGWLSNDFPPQSAVTAKSAKCTTRSLRFRNLKNRLSCRK